jgi:AraC-like DNA-binding protein
MASLSYFVPAAGIWALVRRRQEAWGYDDDEMARWLGLGRTVDTRALMSRPMAERILRRLCDPAPATANTAELNRRLKLAGDELDRECLRAARTAAIKRSFARGLSVSATAIELGLSDRTIQRIARQAGLTPPGAQRLRQSRAS